MTFIVYCPDMKRDHSYSYARFDSLNKAKEVADGKMEFIKEHYTFDLSNDGEVLHVTDKETGAVLKHYDTFGIEIRDEITEPCSDESHYEYNYRGDGTYSYNYISTGCLGGTRTVSNERVYEKYWNSPEEVMVCDTQAVNATSYEL
jgi:hypothetical protein